MKNLITTSCWVYSLLLLLMLGLVQISLPDQDGNGMTFAGQILLSLPWSVIGGLTIGWEFGDSDGRIFSVFLFACGMINAGILYFLARRTGISRCTRPSRW